MKAGVFNNHILYFWLIEEKLLRCLDALEQGGGGGVFPAPGGVQVLEGG